MNHPQAVRHASRNAISPTPTGSPPRLDPQLRAAAILGRIIDFFDAVDVCSCDVLERTRGLLVDELEVGRTDGSRAPRENRRRNAVLTAALACVHHATEQGDRSRGEAMVVAPSWLLTTGPARSTRPMRAGRIMYLLLRVLDGFETLPDRGSADDRPRAVDILAHMLRGPEPQSWTRQQQDFARCALEWMKSQSEDPTAGDLGAPTRWSTSPRPGSAMRPLSGGSTGMLSA